MALTTYNLLSLTGGGKTASFQYDPLNRPIQMDDPAGTTSYEYTPDSNLRSVTRPGNRKISYRYNAPTGSSGPRTRNR